MRKTREALLVACLTTSLAVSLAVQTSTVVAQDTASEDGWNNLFNGKDLSGWRIGDDGDFKVEDGAIVVRGARAYLFTEERVPLAKGDSVEMRFSSENHEKPAFGEL